MFIISLIRYFFGYVRFEIYGRYPERLLNVLSSKRVSVWDVVRRGDRIEACIPIRDYRRLHALKGKCRIRVRHTETVGFFVKLSQYRDKVGFAVGILAFFLIIKVLSLFIWQIEIVGNTGVNDADIYAALEKVGIHYGTRTASVDAFNIGEKLLLEMPELAWAAVNIEGSKATVDVSEVRDVPDRDDPTPCNLKARIDGRIVGHTVTDGKMVVQTGDAVVAGDLLVSGMIEYKNGTVGLKHASGTVIAETKHTVTWFEPYSGVEKVRTGAEKTKYALEFFGLKLPLYLGSEQYPYESSYEEVPLVIAGCRLPISLHKAKFYAICEKAYTHSAEKTESIAREKIEDITKSELPDVEIMTKNEEIRKQNDGILIQYLYICHENIAFEEILSISTINFADNML